MATALASTLIERVFSYRKEVMAFRQWQDSAMDISVYMLITTGVIAATTKPQPQVGDLYLGGASGTIFLGPRGPLIEPSIPVPSVRPSTRNNFS